jgi:hypothetical protein
MSVNNIISAAVGAAIFGAGIFLGSKLLESQSPASRQEVQAPPKPTAPSPVPQPQTTSFQQPAPKFRVFTGSPCVQGRDIPTSPLSSKFELSWSPAIVCQWLNDIGCMHETVAFFKSHNINGEGLYSFIEKDGYGFETEDKLTWFGIKNTKEVELLTAHLRTLSAPK